MQNLLPQEVEEAIKTLEGWALDTARPALTKTYKFKSFAEAIHWMGRIAPIADELNHHPEWKNIYNRVEVVLTTHDTGGITELDVKLAAQMDVIK